MRSRLVLLAVILFAGPVAAVQPDKESVIEIAHLFSFIRASGCQFSRNGSWYPAVEAAEHIDRKYRYVLDKGLVGSTDDFIKYAATKSSFSGNKYLVQCNGADPVASAGWLQAELLAFRESTR